MATINSAEDNNLIENMVINLCKNNPKTCGHRFWTSGNDLAEHGIYTWAATADSLLYTTWAAVEPNHLITGTEVEHCVDVSTVAPFKTNLTWNDNLCSRKLYYICETKSC